MKSNILPAIRLTLVCLVFFCGVYTMLIWAVAQLAPNHGKGETVMHQGNAFYINIAQSFSSDRYFHSRPSAVNYNAAASGGSNKGPTNPDYFAEVAARIDTVLAHNPGISISQIPSDMVTASGAGLDPHLSVQAAMIQSKRIAKARQLTETQVRDIIESQREQPLFGLVGTEKVNILKLNIALDGLQPRK